MPLHKETGLHIPFFKTINEFLEGIHSAHRTQNPLLLCLRLEDTFPDTIDVMPPFRKDFYFISLVTDTGDTLITYDNVQAGQLDSFLVFQSPGHIYSWHRDKTVRGYLIYFKKDCFPFFRPEFDQEFPFFDVLQTNFFKLSGAQFNSIAPLFEDLFDAYQRHGHSHQDPIAPLKLLALLYQLKQFTTTITQLENSFSSTEQLVFQKFLQLINNYYLEKRTVKEYADLLHMTAHHLSQSVKAASQKNALYFINDKLLKEAKTLIRYTDMDIAEIAYQLQFSDAANFGKFFKKHTGQTPLEYRKRR